MEKVKERLNTHFAKVCLISSEQGKMDFLKKILDVKRVYLIKDKNSNRHYV